MRTSGRPDRIEIMQRLCVIAGTIMEDVSVEAVSRLSSDAAQRAEHIRHLQRAGDDIAALLTAAAVLDRRVSEND